MHSRDERQRCVVCDERPARNPTAQHALCGTCRASICRLQQLPKEQWTAAQRRAHTRVRRVLAARLGVDGLVVFTQHVLSQPNPRS